MHPIYLTSLGLNATSRSPLGSFPCRCLNLILSANQVLCTLSARVPLAVVLPARLIALPEKRFKARVIHVGMTLISHAHAHFGVAGTVSAAVIVISAFVGSSLRCAPIGMTASLLNIRGRVVVPSIGRINPPFTEKPPSPPRNNTAISRPDVVNLI